MLIGLNQGNALVHAPGESDPQPSGSETSRIPKGGRSEESRGRTGVQPALLHEQTPAKYTLLRDHCTSFSDVQQENLIWLINKPC